jgi:hypothetical protein
MPEKMSLESFKYKPSFLDKFQGVIFVILAYIIIHYISIFKISKLIKIAKYICIREISIEEADIMWETVLQSSSFFPGRIACLEQSLAFVLFAAAKRLSVVWCVGVRINPFEAHAWAELDGKPFRESENVEKEFKKIFSI